MRLLKTKGEDISPNMIGLFFEDINFAADGGLYAELIENRSFEARNAFGNPGNFYAVDDYGYAWGPVEASGVPIMQYVTGTPLSEANPHYLRFTGLNAGQGFKNKSYDGIFLKKNDRVNVVFYARCVKYDGLFHVAIKKDDKEICGADIQPRYAIPFHPFSNFTVEFESDLKEENQKIDAIRKLDKTNMSPASEWVKYEISLVATEDVKGGNFEITLNTAGVVDFDFISVIPDDAVAGVFRKDLFEALKGIKPGFIRFPGGCVVEGISLENRYRWKQTVGENIHRKYIPNLWAFDDDRSKELNAQRPDSHYGQSYGIGFYEYFLLCELLGAKALPVLSMGVACQFRSTEVTELGSPEFLEFVQDAVDLIEFANGDINTKWGSLRAKMGHPESFNMDMIAIGNEQWETDSLRLFERNDVFEKAIHDKYPGFKILGTAGPAVDMPTCGIAWDYYRAGKKNNEDFCYAVDEHYYKSPQWMYDNISLYDDYSRDLFVFAGEYATHTEKRENSMESALAEAAFMTGLEKNAGVVKLASYAPLFNRIGHSQWKPDMIWFDAEEVYLTPNYYVQKLYGNNLGVHTLELSEDAFELRTKGIYVSASENADGETILKLVNTTADDFVLPVEDANGKEMSFEANLQVLVSDGNYVDIERPEKTHIEESHCKVDGKLILGAHTFTIAKF